jgi:hypothetical protein
MTKTERSPTGSGWWIFVLGEAAGVEWVMNERMMAFSRHMCTSAAKIREGDYAFIYQTKKLLRDTGRLTALARITSGVEERKVAISAGFNFACACSLEFVHTVEPSEGVALGPIVSKLSFVQRKDLWPHYLRRGLVKLPEGDGVFLANALGAPPKREG